jgi:WD40 repeat protein
MSALIVCQDCSARVRPVSSRGALRCPRCEAKIQTDAPKKARPAEEEDDRPARRRPEREAAVSEKPRKRRPDPADEAEEDEPRRGKDRPAAKSNPLLWILCGLAAAVLVFGAAGAAVVVALWPRPEPVAQTQPVKPDPVADNKRPDEKRADEKDDQKRPDPTKEAPQQLRRREAAWVDDSQAEALPAKGNERPHLVLDAAGHTATVRRALFLPDGRHVVTVSFDKSVRIWDVRSGETVRTFRLPVGPGPEGSITTAALSPDGTLLAVTATPLGNAGEEPIFLLDLAKGRVERVLRGHRNSVNGLDFSRDGGRLVSASSDRLVIVHDVRTGEKKNVIKAHTDAVISARFSPDGTRVLTGGRDAARVITLNNNATEHVLAGVAHKWAAVRGVAWSRDGKAMATASEDGLVRIWDRAGKMTQEVNLSERHKVNITLSSVTFANDDEVIYGGVNGTGQVGVVEARTGKVRLEFTKHTNSVYDVGVSPDGKLGVSTGGNDHDTYVWDMARGDVVQHLKGLGHSGWGVGWSRDGKHVAFGDSNRGLQASREVNATFRLDSFGVGGKPDGKEFRAVEKMRTKQDRIVSLDEGHDKEGKRDLYAVDVLVNGKKIGAFRSRIKTERLYSWTLLPGERMIVGGAFQAYLIDLAIDRPGQAKVLRTFSGHSGIFLSIAPSPDFKYFVTGSTDQTLCFWRPDQDRPLMSVFVAESEWIAWTGEGYYACSAAGERLMGWQINQGAEQVGAYHPAARFRRSLFRPAALQQLLPAGGIQAALAKLGQNETTNVSQVLPPEVEITAPRTGVKQAGGKVEVVAEARSVGGKAVAQLRLLVNGRPYEGERGVRTVPNPKPGKVRAAWSVDLPPGKHVLNVVAATAVSAGVSPPVLVENTTADEEAPALYVLAVGVSDYPGDMKLNFAASDARNLVAALQKYNNGSFRDIQARVLTDREATCRGVVEGLKWLGEKMTARDVAIVFLSGHGTRDDHGNFYFVPFDVSEQDVAGTCIPGEALKRALGNLPGRVVAMFDACHSGAAAEKRAIGRTDDLARDLITEDYGIVCLCSSMGNEFSLESGETRAGFFTFALIAGLAGAADFNRDKTVHLHELAFYAKLRVRQMSRGMQNPTVGRPLSFRTFAMSKPR